MIESESREGRREQARPDATEPRTQHALNMTAQRNSDTGAASK